MNGGGVAPDLRAAVRRALGRSGPGAVAGDPVDLVDVATRVAWSVLVEPGDGIAGALIDGLGPAQAFEAVLRADDDGVDGLLAECLEYGVGGSDDAERFGAALRTALARWSPRLPGVDVLGVLDAAATVGARLLVPGAPGWPEGVGDLGVHAPLVLWARSGGRGRPDGADDPFDAPTVAVVGSRANTVAGAEAAGEITSRAADSGCTVVSGGAYGIDATAHRVAIAAGATTVAVLAGGIDQLYPAGNVDLLRNVVQCGAVVAESPPGTRPSRWRFLARNRLIAAMADVTVVVEAGARSGALNTAHHAGQLGRTVFAVPGPFASSASVGCHRLVADGRAQLMVHPGDATAEALRARGGPAPTSAATPIAAARTDPEVVRALDALGRRALPVEEVARRSGMSLAETTDALALAQIQGLAQYGVGGWSGVPGG